VSIQATPAISIDERELDWSYIRAPGPGGQNVNKVASAVQLRWDIRHSPSLPDPVRARLQRLAGRRLTLDGVLVIQARRFRTQERNRQDALDRVIELVQQAAIPPTPRRATRVPFGERKRRLEAKTHRSTVKRLRSGPVE
jgi:ribosome-associated protein